MTLPPINAVNQRPLVDKHTLAMAMYYMYILPSIKLIEVGWLGAWGTVLTFASRRFWLVDLCRQWIKSILIAPISECNLVLNKTHASPVWQHPLSWSFPLSKRKWIIWSGRSVCIASVDSLADKSLYRHNR